MTSLWDPETVLGLHPRGPRGSTNNAQWRCVGHIVPREPTADRGLQVALPEQRCDRPIRPGEVFTIRKLLADMSRQLPDQVDHNVLLHLARACLCVDGTPEPHRDRQEASIIYEWTGLMGKEAERLRPSRGGGAGGAGDADPHSSSASSRTAERDRDEGTEESWDTETIVSPTSPRLIPRRPVVAHTQLQAVSASTISQRRSSPPTASESPSPSPAPGSASCTVTATPAEPTPTAGRGPSLSLSLSNLHNSAHHPHAPPSPPDSATYSSNSSGGSTMPFPPLPLYQPVPLSFNSVHSISSGSSGSSIPPPLQTSTTIHTSSSSSSGPPKTPSSAPMSVLRFETPPLLQYETLMFNGEELPTPHYSRVFTNVPPPLPTSTTIATGSSLSSAGSCSTRIGPAYTTRPRVNTLPDAGPPPSGPAMNFGSNSGRTGLRPRPQRMQQSSRHGGRSNHNGVSAVLYPYQQEQEQQRQQQQQQRQTQSLPTSATVPLAHNSPPTSALPHPVAATTTTTKTTAAATTSAENAAASQLRDCTALLRTEAQACVAEMVAARLELAAARNELSAIKVELASAAPIRPIRAELQHDSSSHPPHPPSPTRLSTAVAVHDSYPIWTAPPTHPAARTPPHHHLPVPDLILMTSAILNSIYITIMTLATALATRSRRLVFALLYRAVTVLSVVASSAARMASSLNTAVSAASEERRGRETNRPSPSLLPLQLPLMQLDGRRWRVGDSSRRKASVGKIV